MDRVVSMDLIDTLSHLSGRIPVLKESIQTEEATKNALIMPFIQALGYNVFDPFEVIPEYTADVGTKKNEKVDYVISKDGEALILIECKCIGSELNVNHASQLYRYFGVTTARFAILTNGVDYRFYTDIEAPNKMDDRPFFEFSMLKLNDRIVSEIKKFTKQNFNLNNILSTASELKYKKQIRAAFSAELSNPSDDFVRLFAKQVYTAPLTPDRKDQFRLLVGQAFQEWVNNKIGERLQSAINQVEDTEKERVVTTLSLNKNDGGIITTEEESESFLIVRAILAQIIDPSRICLKDTKSYCGILLDNNVRKPLCRLVFTSSQKTLIIVDKERNETKYPLKNTVDLYKYTEELILIAKEYM